MTKTLQEELLNKKIVKDNSVNKSLANPFSNKKHLNRYGKPMRWRLWIKSFKFPKSYIKICAMCGRKESGKNRGDLVRSEKLLTEMRSQALLKGHILMIYEIKVCKQCNELVNKDDSIGWSSVSLMQDERSKDNEGDTESR